MKRSPIKKKFKICKTCGLPKILWSHGNCQGCDKIIKAARPPSKTKVAKLIKKDPRNKTTKELKAELDDWYSYYIRLKHTNNGLVGCVTCSEIMHPKDIQNGHYISRNHLATRYLDQNCHPQCYHCNVRLKGNYTQYALFMLSKYGKDVLDYLNTIKHNKIKWGQFEYGLLIKDYQAKVIELLKLKNIDPWFKVTSEQK